MAGNFQPLDQKFAIVDGRGQPTDYFIRWAQEKQIDIGEAITLLQLQEYLDDHALQEGSGIQITPSGSLNDSPTIDADAQEILDQISATRGTILYRGLLGWAGLPPGAAGQLLQSAGPGADPAWAAGAAGAADWVLSASWDFAVSGAVASLVSGDLTNKTDVMVIVQNVTTVNVTHRVVEVSVNGGASYITSSNYKLLAVDGTVSIADGALYLHSTGSSAARSGFATLFGINKAINARFFLAYPRTGGEQAAVLFDGSASVINRIRVKPATGGNMNGGRVWIYAR